MKISNNYYAEFKTDKNLREKYLKDNNENDVVVEVGGASPEYLSMSKHFLESGWKCIIVEPNPEFIKQHKEDALKYKLGQKIIVEAACSEKELLNHDFTIVSSKKPVIYENGFVTDHSFSSISLKSSYRISIPKDVHFKKIKVDIRRLDDILKKINIKKVRLLSVDVEGWELEVIKGINLESIIVDVIVLENWRDEPYYQKFMFSKGYKLIEIIHHNYIYVRKENYSNLSTLKGRMIKRFMLFKALKRNILFKIKNHQRLFKQ